MEPEGLEDLLKIQMNMKIRFKDPDTAMEGMVIKYINPMERERYAQGTMRDIVDYMVKEDPELDQDQKDTQAAIKSCCERDNPGTPAVLLQYDPDNRRLPEDADPGPIYLNTPVAQILEPEDELLNLGISNDHGVGYK